MGLIITVENNGRSGSAIPSKFQCKFARVGRAREGAKKALIREIEHGSLGAFSVAVDQLMVDLIEDMGGNVIRSGLWT